MRRHCVMALIALVLLAACGGSQGTRERQEAMDLWSSYVRWNEFDALLNFIHPEWLAENPISELDIERLRQFRVTEYRVRQVLFDPDGQGAERIARIRLYHLHSSRERVIDHREVWRYDSDLKAWLLHSGLPDPRRH